MVPSDLQTNSPAIDPSPSSFSPIVFLLLSSPHWHLRYDLVATGCHEGAADGGSYSCLLYHYPDQEWYRVEDLSVKEVRPEIVAIAEAYFQIYSRESFTKASTS